MSRSSQQFTPYPNNLTSKMSEASLSDAHTDYTDYTNYMIGSYSSELEKINFTNRRQTCYLAAVKYNADLVWNHYKTQANTDGLNNILLSLHPLNLLKNKDISGNSRVALFEVSKFRDLILLNDYSKAEIEYWLEVATSMNYSAQLCLMGWFLTLSSKMTGFKIPGVQKMLVGGRIKKGRRGWQSTFTA